MVKLTDDLRDPGEQVSENRVARLARLAGILAQVGYKRRPRRYGGKPAVAASNSLDRRFEVDAPDKVWATDITYSKTHERIRRRTYLTREAARQDVFNDIEMSYNPKRKHTNNGMLSPVHFETRQQKLNEAGA